MSDDRSRPSESPFALLTELRRKLEALGEVAFAAEFLGGRPALLFLTPEGLDSDETLATEELFARAQAPDPSSWYFDTAALLRTRTSPRPNEVLVGRTSDSDLIFALPGVSRTHALLIETGSRWTVCDLGSQAGTFLNGRRLEPEIPAVISDGDRLAFGSLLSLRFCLPATLIRALDPSA